MKTRSIAFVPFVLAAVAVVVTACGPRTTAAADLHPWEVFELELSAQRELALPYVDGLPDGQPAYVTAVFRCQPAEGQAAEHRTSGFYDGGRTWRVRFAPPHAGKWSYRTQSADPGLDAHSGQFNCTAWTDEQKQANATRRGLIRVCQSGPRPGRYFEYSDGTPVLWLGDTWWNWTKRAIPLERFQHLVDDRAAKGFNVGQLFFPARGWSSDASLLDGSFTRPDLEHIREVEEMIRYANSKGITVWVHGWWVQPKMAEAIGAENIRRWCRYMQHRLSAYNVIWVLAGEYNMHDYGGLGLDFWKQLGALMEAEDPHERLIGAHPTPPGWQGGDPAPQWSTAVVMHEEPWLDYNQSQVGHGRWRNEMIPAVVAEAYRQQPPKPIVVTEPWYEFVEGTPTATDIRFGGWSAILSGAAGHSYGGGHVWRAHVPESPAPRGSWPLELGLERDTLDYPGAQSLAYMARLLHDTRWWLLEPHPELVQENTSHYCAARPGGECLVYLRYGGVLKLDLSAWPAGGPLEYRWFDLVEQKPRKGGTVEGGAVGTFRAPEDYPGVEQFKDWLLYVKPK